jgi:hypothetical protein
MVDFGALDDSVGIIGLTCDWLSGSTILESDTRFNKVMNFANGTYNWLTDSSFGSCAPGFHNYIVDEIATHERGVGFGLADVTNTGHPELTSYGFAGPCEVQKENLALGDMLALETLY